MKRPETGTMQFPNDWPGVFIRGDNALRYAMALEHLIMVASTHAGIEVVYCRGLVDLLKSCDARQPEMPGLQFPILEDARLIAAVPELLELVRLLTWHTWPRGHRSRLHLSAEALIAKAEGRNND